MTEFTLSSFVMIRQPIIKHVDLTPEQEATAREWLDRMASEFLAQSMGYTGPHIFWVDEYGMPRIEPVDPVETSAPAYSPTVVVCPES
jgi:hypothetical protein